MKRLKRFIVPALSALVLSGAAHNAGAMKCLNLLIVRNLQARSPR